MTSVADDLALALELADAADALTLDRFGALDLRIETKPDLTPVTDADKSAEELLRVVADGDIAPTIRSSAKSSVAHRLSAGRQWVLDPIDGTKNFVRGVPVWCTLIALLVDGAPVVGVVSAPALGRRWWAGEGEGAFTSFGGATAAHLRSPESTTSPRPACRSPTYHRLGGPPIAFHRPHRRGLAGARLRRLLVLLPGGRGCRRHRRRT